MKSQDSRPDPIYLTIKRKVYLSFLCMAFLFSAPAFGHVPHDDIYRVEISPAYSQDHTLFIIVRKNLFRSTDGGRNWVRLVNGLDNKHPLSSLAISSQTKDVLYASSVGDGVYKSVDAGASWHKVNDGLASLKIDKLFVSPFSDKVVFACGENGGSHRTDNGGAGWREVMPSDIKITAVGFLGGKNGSVVIGTNKGALYFCGRDGNARQGRTALDNGGDTGAITVIAVSPGFSDDRTFYIGTEKRGVFKTATGGASFYQTCSLPPAGNVRDIQYLPGRKGRECLAVSLWHEGVFFTGDGGDMWQKRSDGLVKDSQADTLENMAYETESAEGRPHFSDIRVSNGYLKDKTIFLGSFTGLYKSINGGQSWKHIDTMKNIVTGLAVSPDYRNDSTVVTAGYTGESYMTGDASPKWRCLSRYLKNVQVQTHYFTIGAPEKHVDVLGPRFFDVVFSPAYSVDRTVYFTASWMSKGLLLYREGRWESLQNAPGGVAIACSPDLAKDKAVFRASRGGDIYRSNDRGISFEKVASLGVQDANVPVSLIFSPGFSSDKTLYYVHFIAGIYMSEDGGYSWKNITKDSPLAGRSGVQAAISPDYKNDKTLVAGTDGGIYVTKNAGKSWVRAGEAVPVGDGVIEALAISPDYKNDRTFLVSVRGEGLFRTKDGGNTFSHIGDDAISLSRVNCPSASMPIQFSPSYAADRTIYGYGSAGGQIYKSTDRGDSWRVIALPGSAKTVIDYAYDRLLIMKKRIDSLKKEFKKKLASLIVAAGRYKRMLWRSIK